MRKATDSYKKNIFQNGKFFNIFFIPLLLKHKNLFRRNKENEKQHVSLENKIVLSNISNCYKYLII